MVEIRGTSQDGSDQTSQIRLTLLMMSPPRILGLETHGDPQGSGLGPVLLTWYLLPFANIGQHGINGSSYADDTRIYL